MKASVQYNDYLGSSAADISDHTTLNKFIENRGVSTERYNAIGAEFYAGYSDFFTASIICEDKEVSALKMNLLKTSFLSYLSDSM